jgi:branched-chain amino acid transport system ATP-binding protein
MLEICHLNASYGAVQALKDVTLHVSVGELVALIGSNGAGKTTLMRAISGLVSTSGGSISFLGQDLVDVRPHERVIQGIAHVPEGRHVFGDQSVRDNLELGAYTREASAPDIAEDIDQMFAIFPRLRERTSQKAATLSGGEQQMLAIARALMSRPKLLLLDEPSLGLAPIVVREIFALIRRLKAEGVTILLVEQLANLALAIADRAYVLETGQITLDGEAQLLRNDDRVRKAYLGGAVAEDKVQRRTEHGAAPD